MTQLMRQVSKALFAGLDLLAGPAKGVRMLIYHQIGGGSGLQMEVSPEAFRKQLRWLAINVPVVDLDSAITDPGQEAVVLTFDDGYRSVYEQAFPILAEHGMPFTLYLTTEPIESGRSLRDHPGGEPLEWGMVEEMTGSGLLTVASHTHTHPDLRWLDESSIRAELEASDVLIDERLGVTPEHFAYPWGYWSEVADGPVRERYRSAALGSRLPRRKLTDPHLIHRVPVQASDGGLWYSARVRRGLVFEESARRRLRGYSGY